MAKLEEREQEMEKQERIIKEMKQQEIEGCVHIKELEVTNQQREVRKMELEEKLRNMKEEIRKLYEENGGLKNKSEVGMMQTPTTSFADILKKETATIPEKTRLIETSKRNTRPTIVLKPKDGETIRDVRMKLTNTISIYDRINFQMIQAKTALILQMATEQDEIKIRQHPGMMKNFDLMNRNNKRNPLMIVYGIPSEMKEIEAIEEMIDRNLNDITEEQKQLIKPRFKTGPKKQDRYHLVFEVPKQVRERILKSPRA